jgi:hypothetical protein
MLDPAGTAEIVPYLSSASSCLHLQASPHAVSKALSAVATIAALETLCHPKSEAFGATEGVP